MALSRLAMSIGIACPGFELERRQDAAQSFSTYGLDLCRAAAKIAGRPETRPLWREPLAPHSLKLGSDYFSLPVGSVHVPVFWSSLWQCVHCP